MLARLERLVRNLRVMPKNMKRNLDLTHGLIHSQQVLLLLTERGMSREDAYLMVQRHAMACWETGRDLKALMLEDEALMKQVRKADLEKAFDLSTHLRDVDRTFRILGLG